MQIHQFSAALMQQNTPQLRDLSKLCGLQQRASLTRLLKNDWGIWSN